MKFCCPLHGNSEGVRVASVDVRDLGDAGKELVVNIECVTCAEHLGTTVLLPYEPGIMEKYELPEIGSNIYNPLKNHLRKQGE